MNTSTASGTWKLSLATAQWDATTSTFKEVTMEPAQEYPEGFDFYPLQENDMIYVGSQSGLTEGLSLQQKCADFYVLESLVRETHSWEGQPVSPRDLDSQTRSIPPPRDWFSDSRSEFRALEIGTAYKELVNKLADEFALYLTLAAGGELRYVPHFFSKWIERSTKSDDHWMVHSGEKESKLSCCKYNFKTPTEPHLVDKLKAIRALCRKGECTHWSEVASYLKTCDCKCPHNHMRSCTDGYFGCTAPAHICCAHKTVTKKKDPWKHFKVPNMGLAREYFNLLQDEGSTSGTKAPRALGWGWWENLYKQNPPTYMYLARDMFNLEGVWGGSQCGGPRWAMIAGLAADYYSGLISKTTLIDRCWSLQHNGGCVFDKFYDVNHLTTVLELQHENRYEELARNHASDYPKSLWFEYERSQGRFHIKPHKVKASRGGKEINDITATSLINYLQSLYTYNVSGCFSCAVNTWINADEEFITTNSILDACSWGQIDEANPSCAYTGSHILTAPYAKWRVDINKVEYGDGCLACGYEAMGYVQDDEYEPESFEDVCGTGSPFTVYCAYATGFYDFLVQMKKEKFNE